MQKVEKLCADEMVVARGWRSEWFKKGWVPESRKISSQINKGKTSVGVAMR
jgi:hypothetical protein